MSRIVIFLSLIAGGQMVLQDLTPPYPPSLVAAGYNQSVVQGDPFTLDCHISASKNGEQTQTIMWKLEDKVLQADDVRVRIDPNMNITILRKPSNNHLPNSYSTYLMVRQADQSYAGRYFCVVEWTTDQDPKENMYVVSITIPPTIQATNTRVEKTEGEDAELSCVARGTPRPRVHWTRKKSEHQLDTPVGENKPIMHLKNLTREDSGMYSCMATNGAGYPARDTILLVVQYAPQVTSLPTELVSDYTGRRSAYLSCMVDSSPASQVVWHRNDMLLNKVSTSNRTHYTLKVERVRESDLGSYECIASNNIGEGRDHILLSGEPTHVTIADSSFTSIDQIQLAWHTESFAPVNTTTIFYRKSDYYGSAWSHLVFHHPAVSRTGRDSSQFSFLLRDLQPDTNYEVKLKSSNQFGDSPESNKVFFKTRQVGYGEKSRYSAGTGQDTENPTSAWGMWGKRNSSPSSTHFSLTKVMVLSFMFVLQLERVSQEQ